MRNNYPLVNLKDFVFFQEGPGIRSYEYSENGCKMINVKCIKDGQLDLSDTKFVSWDKINKDWNHFLVGEDDILVTTSGTIGRVAKVNKKDLPILMNTSVIRFRPLDKNKIDSDYLMFFLSSQFFYKQLQKQTTEMCIKNVGPTHIKKMKLILPPYPQQKCIVDVLKKADALLKKRREADELGRNIVQSVFIEEFVASKKRRFPSVKIKDLVIDGRKSIHMGPFGSQLKVKELVSEGRIIVLGIDNVMPNKFVRKLDKRITEKKYEQLKRYTVRPGDVLITMMGTVGRCCVVPEDLDTAIISSHLLKITPDQNKCLPIYLSTALNSITSIIQAKSHGAIMSGLNTSIIKDLDITLPPLYEQRKFADLVQKVEKIKEKQQESKQDLGNLFDVLMQKTFKTNSF